MLTGDIWPGGSKRRSIAPVALAVLAAVALAALVGLFSMGWLRFGDKQTVPATPPVAGNAPQHPLNEQAAADGQSTRLQSSSPSKISSREGGRAKGEGTPDAQSNQSVTSSHIEERRAQQLAARQAPSGNGPTTAPSSARHQPGGRAEPGMTAGPHVAIGVPASGTADTGSSEPQRVPDYEMRPEKLGLAFQGDPLTTQGGGGSQPRQVLAPVPGKSFMQSVHVPPLRRRNPL